MAELPGPVTVPAAGSSSETPIAGLNTLVTMAAAVIVIAALYLARDVLIPITLAVLLSFLLAPLASLLRRAGIPRTVSVLAAVFLALSIILGVAAVIGIQLAGLAEDYPRYEETIRRKVETVRSGVFHEFQIVQAQISGATSGPASSPTSRPQGTDRSPVTVQVKQPEMTPLTVARNVLGPLMAPLGTTALVVIVSIFVLLQKDDLRDRLIRLFGSSDLHRTTLAMNEAASRLSHYFLTQLAINTSFGIVVGLGLAVIGIPSPAVWGLLALLMRFIPYVGVYLSAALPVLLAAAVAPGWGLAAWTLALFLLTELITGQVVEPLAYGHSTGLSPVSVVVSAIFWTWIWGPIGLLLSTPLTLCMVVLGRHVKRLEFLDVALGDQPALTPVETLYQRVLANDPDEAATQADLYLRDHPLESYFEDVALQALMLAANDMRRGVISRERSLALRTTFSELAQDLEDQDGAAPPEDAPIASPAEETPSVPPGPVLCLGGRTALDDAAALMLVQLMRRRGLDAQIVVHEAVSRGAIAGLDMAGARCICVSYMEATGSAAHLRFLLRRLKQRAPQAFLVLALWSETVPRWEEEAVRPADAVANSYRGAIASCLSAPAEPARNAA